jgi:hypothetical protein
MRPFLSVMSRDRDTVSTLPRSFVPQPTSSGEERDTVSYWRRASPLDRFVLRVNSECHGHASGRLRADHYRPGKPAEPS